MFSLGQPTRASMASVCDHCNMVIQTKLNIDTVITTPHARKPRKRSRSPPTKARDRAKTRRRRGTPVRRSTGPAGGGRATPRRSAGIGHGGARRWRTCRDVRHKTRTAVYTVCCIVPVDKNGRGHNARPHQRRLCEVSGVVLIVPLPAPRLSGAHAPFKHMAAAM